jgi:hypothetical protein
MSVWVIVRRVNIIETLTYLSTPSYSANIFIPGWITVESAMYASEALKVANSVIGMVAVLRSVIAKASNAALYTMQGTS